MSTFVNTFFVMRNNSEQIWLLSQFFMANAFRF